MVYDIRYFINSKIYSFLHFNSLKSGQHFIIIIGNIFSFLMTHKIMVCLNGVSDPTKHSILVNKLPKSGIIYKAINSV